MEREKGPLLRGFASLEDGFQRATSAAADRLANPDLKGQHPANGASLTRRLNREGGNAEERFRETMAKAIEIACTSRACVPGSKEGADIDYATAPEDSFEFGLKVILDGPESELVSQETI